MQDKFRFVNGSVLLSVAFLGLLETFTLISGNARFIWPTLIFFVGLWGMNQKGGIFSGMLLLGGPAEILRTAGLAPMLLGLIWPIILFLCGWMLRKGTVRILPIQRSDVQLGGVLMLLGVSRLILVFSGINMGTVDFGWIFFAGAAGFILIRKNYLEDDV